MPTLQWLGREEAVAAADNAPFRLLEHDPDLSAGDANTENLLIQGDNLDALKALLPVYAGRVKCIFIDPPYNTGSAFEHYDDNLEHSQWLSLMYPRMELLRDLLAEDGSIWITIDDDEAHYLKVICDEVFGRKNFVANVVWQKRTSPDARLNLGPAQDHILVYARSERTQRECFNKLPVSSNRKDAFKNPDDDSRGPWASTDFTGQTGHATPSQFFTIVAPNGKKHPPPDGRCWALNEDSFYRLVNDGRVWFGKDGNARPRLKRFLSEVEGQTCWTWWENKEVGHNQEGKKEINVLFGADSQFDTPKPERLIHRILTIATNPGDLVLDSFLGSGTTAAVAHKMGRRYIGIEMGDHAVTHCVPRLRKVIEGEQGGISKDVEWKGGGGFRFMRLGPAVFDETGALNPEIRFPNLAAHIWFSETKTPWAGSSTGIPPVQCGQDGRATLNHGRDARATLGPLLGIHKGIAYYLLFNGILGDRRPESGNVLNASTFKMLPPHDGPKVIYGEWSQWRTDRLRREGITFRMIPYEIKAR